MIFLREWLIVNKQKRMEIKQGVFLNICLIWLIFYYLYTLLHVEYCPCTACILYVLLLNICNASTAVLKKHATQIKFITYAGI